MSPRLVFTYLSILNILIGHILKSKKLFILPKANIMHRITQKQNDSMFLKKDKRLLNELDIDSRRPLSGIAKLSGMSQQLAGYKLKSFLEQGLITGFYACVDYSRFGYSCYKA